MKKKYPPTRNLRDIGQVVPFIEKMDAAREASSCCIGVEAALESNKNIDSLMKRLSSRISSEKSD